MDDKKHLTGGNGFRWAPLFWIRFFWGTCYCDDSSGRMELFRPRRRLIAIRRSDGSWYIRRKYRLIYSQSFIRRLTHAKMPLSR